MDKITIIVVLIVLAIVLAAAISRKSVFKFIKDLELKRHVPNVKLGSVSAEEKHTDKRFGTILVADLEMYQLNSDGSSFYKHSITKKDMQNSQGEMVGLSISHPGAQSEGLILFGKKRKDGSYDDKDSGTYAALTVNTDSVRIGYDEKGFYGEVTNVNARVYEVIEKKTKLVPYGATFNISDKTYLLIGNQWLYFTAPSIPAFPGARIAGQFTSEDGFDDSSSIIPTFREQEPAGMKKRGTGTKVANPIEKSKQDKKMTIRFPTDE